MISRRRPCEPMGARHSGGILSSVDCHSQQQWERGWPGTACSLSLVTLMAALQTLTGTTLTLLEGVAPGSPKSLALSALARTLRDPCRPGTTCVASDECAPVSAIRTTWKPLQTHPAEEWSGKLSACEQGGR
jgi:hypothetical protein